MTTESSLHQLVATGVRDLKPYQPGKPVEELERELGVSEIIKLASNENPRGASPRVESMLKECASDLARYPDGSGFRLKKELSAQLNVLPSQITLGNGSNDVLDIITRCFVESGQGVVISEHAFAVYGLAAKSVDADLSIVPAIDFGHDLEAMREAINSNTKLVFVANPNNPTGTYVGENKIEAFLSDLPDHVITVLDEAYFEYVRPFGVNDYPDGVALLARFPNLIVTRTFSKAYGLAALRVGYAIATPEITEILNRVRPPFNVNSMGLAAAEAALSDSDFISQCVTENADQLVQLNQAFVDLDLTTIPSVANFICVQVGSNASKIYELMLAQGVIVRPIGNYGLPEHLRITVGLPSENQKVIATLRKIISDLAGA